MFGSEFLEVAIGLALLFLVVSLICTAAREALEGIMKTRAMDLERGIRELLDDPDGSTLTKTLFEHPMLYALFGGKYDPANLNESITVGGTGQRLHMPFRKRRNLPSYIPAGHFASALLDTVLRGPATPAPYSAEEQRPDTQEAMSIESLRSAALAMPNDKIRRAVLSAIDFADGDLAMVKTNIENWFNGTMDRVSGWYKRRTQLILFVMGLGAAAFLNIDAIEVAKRLSRDDALRQAAVAEATAVVQAEAEEAGNSVAFQGQGARELRDSLDRIGYPIGWWGFWPDPQTRPTECSPVPAAAPAASEPAAAAATPTASELADPTKCMRSLSAQTALQIGLGWFITALAAMLGAPFWFDLLNKFMVIRSTVKPHEKSLEEGSEDRQPPPAPVNVIRSDAAPADGRDGNAGQDGGTGAKPQPVTPAVVAPLSFEPHEWKDGSKDGDL